MKLIGYMDSPYVRRVAVSLQFLEIAYEHVELSIWRDYDEFRRINPLVKVPTLVYPDGQVLVDSTLIIDHIERVAGRSLMPEGKTQHRQASRVLGVVLIGMEKTVQLIYEKQHRPEDSRHQPWIDRLEQQLAGAVEIMESSIDEVRQAGHPWLVGDTVTQADISMAVAWRFMRNTRAVNIDTAAFPGLNRFSERAEALPEFLACPLSG